MSIKEQALAEYLQGRNPYPCLNVLESALVCYNIRSDRKVPEELLMDVNFIFGEEIIRAEIDYLIQLDYLEKTDHGIVLKNRQKASAEKLLRQIRMNLPLNLSGKEHTAGEFLENLVNYLKSEVEDLDIKAADGTEFILEWKKKRYCLQLAVSPAWLPAAAEKYAAESGFLAVFGPFAAQNWTRMMKYYAFPEFRNHTAYFDPWSCQKINISKGELFSFFDRFFRDEYNQRFLIPGELPGKLHDMGLLRYNDEK